MKLGTYFYSFVDLYYKNNEKLQKVYKTEQTHNVIAEFNTKSKGQTKSRYAKQTNAVFLQLERKIMKTAVENIREGSEEERLLQYFCNLSGSH